MIVTEKEQNKIEQIQPTKTKLVFDVGVQYRGIYAELFWRPFWGNTSFTLYDTLISFASAQKINVDAVTFSIDILLMMQGGGTRSTLLGRAASGLRRSQEGAVAELVAHQALRHWTRGEGRQLAHEFEVLPWLPALTPSQANQLPKKLIRQHAKFLGCLPYFKLTQWRKVEVDSYIPAMVDCVGYTAVVLRR